jgi:hypothetical protein
MQQCMWKSLGNRFVESHIRGNAQAEEKELLEIVISFVILPCVLKVSFFRVSSVTVRFT